MKGCQWARRAHSIRVLYITEGNFLEIITYLFPFYVFRFPAIFALPFSILRDLKFYFRTSLVTKSNKRM
ncbi:hypothetical protein Y032_0016g3116 [Ancylostoma ceylanicum]|uniref:Uncharacterized protein n=1 Tax=Ancylostoma ceylanicum TaxID=53326 RepID=A0A016V8Q0_9BILA|nr:hypothetical protein Y032_0016g3116 [Ancylostoma ceylanicum]